MGLSADSKFTADAAAAQTSAAAARRNPAPGAAGRPPRGPGAHPGSETGTIAELIGHWAAATPDAPALFDDDGPPLTYGELNAVMADVRAVLNRCGFGRQDRIALIHSGGADMAAAIAAISGCATVLPLNPDKPLGELTLVLRDARIDAVAVEAGLESTARGAAARLDLPVLEIARPDSAATGKIAVRGEEREPGSAARALQPGPAQADDVAVLLETSGTSGRAKLVPVRHRQATARGRNIMGYLALTPADCCLSAMPQFHTGGVTATIWAAFHSGGSAIPVPRMDVDSILRALKARRPTYLAAGYTVFHALHAQAERVHQALAAMQPCLRLLRTGAGRLDPAIARELEQLFGVPVIPAYGSTETGFIACGPLPPAVRKTGSVGRIGAIDVAIMDAAGCKLAAGERGEVVVRGETVVDGYDDDPAANAQALRDGWFRTGDEGYLDNDGYLFLTGRIKDIINRGGQKISPSEIDDALRSHPKVCEAVTFPLPHPTLGEEVAAAVVPAAGATVSTEDLKQHLVPRLTPYKIPRRIAFVDDLPKTASGKIRRQALATCLGLDASLGHDTAVTPLQDRPPSPLEAQIQSLWAVSLGRDHVGLHDDYFDLGGDSLQAVELFLRVEEALGRRLPRSVLIEAGTVAEMARLIEADSTPSCLVPLQRNGSREPFFCIHDILGDVVSLRALARHMGETRPFYGIRYVGGDGSGASFADIESMARYYVDEVRKVQPTGPYHLGGHSFGGQVALVMARQLKAAGEEVALLALIDTYSGIGARHLPPLQRLAAHCRAVAGLPLGDKRDYVLERAGKITDRMRRTLARRRLSGDGQRGNERDVRIALEALSAAYEPQPYDGDAVLFQAQRDVGRHADAHDGWRQLIGGNLRIVPVTGNHMDVLSEPHVRGLADKLAACLDA